MWEGEPVGVDQKRPLVGFAFVAVLCAILMTVSVGRGWADIFQPGKPIAAAALGGPADGEPATVTQPSALADDAEISIPVELSAQPLGVSVGAPVSTETVATSGSRSTAGSGSTSRSRTTESLASLRIAARETAADRTAARQGKVADRKAARQAEKVDRKAHRQAEKADRQADR